MRHALELKEHPVKPKPFVTRVGGWQREAVAVAVVALLFPALALAQGDGPRSYWKGLSGTIALRAGDRGNEERDQRDRGHSARPATDARHEGCGECVCHGGLGHFLISAAGGTNCPL